MSVCWPTAQLEAAKRRYELLHENEPYHDGNGHWAEKPSLDYPFHLSDGTSFWMSPVDLSPDDDFLGQSVPQQAPSDQDQSEDR